MNQPNPSALGSAYLSTITALLHRIEAEEREPIATAAEILANQVAADRLVHVFGPGGHSNLASQEVFFRAGGLMHVSAVLDEGTMLANGALRSMAMERTPGYGRVVIGDLGLGGDDVLVLVNAYGINAALIDAALTAREAGARTIGVSSREHADSTSPDHPARHPATKTCTTSSTSTSTPRSRSVTRSSASGACRSRPAQSRRLPTPLR